MSGHTQAKWFMGYLPLLWCFVAISVTVYKNGDYELGLKLGETWFWWNGFFDFCIEHWREDRDRWRYQDILLSIVRLRPENRTVNGRRWELIFNQRGTK